MPGNCLSLAVRVRGKVDFFCDSGLFLYIRYYISLPLYGDIFGGEIIFNIDAELAFRQVLYMTYRGYNTTRFNKVQKISTKEGERVISAAYRKGKSDGN